MRRPTPISRQIDHELARDLGLLCLVAFLVLTNLFAFGWIQAALLAPVLVAGFVTAVYLLIQVCWCIVVLIDKILVGFHISRNGLN